MNATAVAAALGARAEEVCRRYLPHGRKHGRYWTAGDIRGARGRSLFVRLAPPGTPGKWTDAATGEHGDLLDLIRIASGAGSLRAALAEARAFLSLPPVPLDGGSDSYDRTEAARGLWQRCRAIDGSHAEAYLRARAIHRCRFPALRFHPALFYRDGGGMRRLPALVAAVRAPGAPRDRRSSGRTGANAPAQAAAAIPTGARCPGVVPAATCHTVLPGISGCGCFLASSMHRSISHALISASAGASAAARAGVPPLRRGALACLQRAGVR